MKIGACMRQHCILKGHKQVEGELVQVKEVVLSRGNSVLQGRMAQTLGCTMACAPLHSSWNEWVAEHAATTIPCLEMGAVSMRRVGLPRNAAALRG